ncbi:MAG TPA: hypothetical protein VHQ44_08460, partial [Thermoanaerobaculia bacterium]|nr:hypothetical protein [Thermoanaerobaculia bacterium]
ARAIVGFTVGLVLWWAATPAYNRLLAGFAEGLIRAAERPRATRLYAEERRVVIDRADFPSTSDRPSLPADDLTFDVILFLALAATTPGLFRDRAVRGALVSLAILFALHVLALVAGVEGFYATRLGTWSAANYGAFTRNLWATATHFWRLVGCYAAAFLLWWFLVRSTASPAPSGRSSSPAASAGGPSRASRRRGKA